MRREVRGKKIRENGYSKKVFYIMGSAIAVAIMIVIAILVFVKPEEKEQIAKLPSTQNEISNLNYVVTEQASSQMGKTIQEVESENTVSGNQITLDNTIKENSDNNIIKDNSIASGEKSTEKKEVNTEPVKEVNTEGDKETKTEEDNKEPSFIAPVEGEVLKEYAKEKLVYSNTLKEWVTHTGIDLKAEKTSVVKASADGKVKSIKNDPRYGLTIVIEHSAGYSSVYANLLTSEFVVVGENVKQGQTIGTVGNTATFEIADETHLHFEILKDGIQVDPSLYIK